MRHYVYIHRKADTGKVFYVGKGAGNRVYKISSRTEWWRKIYKKHGRICEIVAYFYEEKDALDLEINLIAEYRAEGVELCNFTDGGEGMTGYKTSEETKKKLSDINKKKPKNSKFTFAGRSHNEESKQVISEKSRAAWGRMSDDKKRERNKKIGEKHRGKIITEEQKEAQRIKMKGRKASEELKGKLSLSRLGKKHPLSECGKQKLLEIHAIKVICIEENKEFVSLAEAARWLKNNGYPSATGSNIGYCLKGKFEKMYGYTWRLADGQTETSGNEV